ncbi:MAG: ATP-binding protein [Lachnospiraceae bacterium]|nr:ATP-binding protein [Lachnospiraceae bacterium]
MYRNILADLLRWKDKKNRKPLILWGARQTGKTWTLQEFGRTRFDDVVYISFFNNRKMTRLFEADYDIRRIINAIEVEMHVRIKPEKTLIIFDEVQNAGRVVESLKYFCETAPEYAVAAAGSLLGVALHEGISFPVGKVDELFLHPMSFYEFLLAMGEDRTAAYLSENDKDRINEFRDHYLSLLKQYYLTGGMPEVIAHYAENRDFEEARQIQLSILHQYEGDFGKHIPAREIARVRMVWEAIPTQLAKENRKFFFGGIRKGARSKEYELAIQWLCDAGLVRRVHKVAKPALPLNAYREPTSYKLFLVDIGLLCAMSELEPGVLLRGDSLFTEFKGALTEQYVQQELAAETAYSLYYYSSEKSTYEVDFLTQKDGGIAPLEVKAGENLKSHSLKVFHDKYHPARSFRTSMSGYREQDWMTNIPLWAIRNL